MKTEETTFVSSERTHKTPRLDNIPILITTVNSPLLQGLSQDSQI